MLETEIVMTETVVTWLATTIIGSFLVQFAFFGLLYSDKVHLPIRWALVFNLLYTSISSAVIYSVLFILNIPIQLTIIFIAANFGIAILFALIVLVYAVIKNKKGVEFGESFINATYTIDLELNFILSRLGKIVGEEILRSVDHGLSHILDIIAQVLDLDPEDDESHISLLLAENGRFRIIAKKSIPLHRISFIEQNFRYGREVLGVAGRAATILQTIYIPDVSDENNPYFHDWIPVERGEQKKGSLYCLPLKRDVGANNEEPLAVLSITSKRINAFDPEIVQDFLSPIVAKIEMFIYILELQNRLDA